MIFKENLEKSIVFVLLLILIYLLFLRREDPLPSLPPLHLFQVNQPKLNRLLVVYIYAQTHNYSRSNLQFFIQIGMKFNSQVDYFIIIQQNEKNRTDLNSLPRLPSNGKYIEHKNECFDIGTFGWFLLSNHTNRRNYEYFALLNSSCRGPYLVSSIENWYDPFIRLLNNLTKLVGPTINCQSGLHVQSYAWILDKQAVEILLDDDEVLSCHETQVAAIYSGEIKASDVLFQKGFSVTSVMKKYENIDLVNKRSEFCSDWKEEDPFSQIDGIYVDPFDRIFVKYKTGQIFDHLRLRLQVYDQWLLFNPSK